MIYGRFLGHARLLFFCNDNARMLSVELTGDVALLYLGKRKLARDNTALRCLSLKLS